jgi:hypothetical protein
MQKKKNYKEARFPAATIQEGYDLFLVKANPRERDEPNRLEITIGDEDWEFDTLEEFLAEYPKSDAFCLDHIIGECRFIVQSHYGTSVLVGFDRRTPIEAVFQIFERDLPMSLPKPLPPTVFIGHGGDSQWRDLRDHLADQHGVKVVAYEIGPRAGLSVKEVLQRMLKEASFALLVLTAEDLHADGELHARENVIHELGLFQGRLGFTRALALVEEGMREFSNILGVNQVRFPKGRIRETFGDVIAALRGEFPQLFSL